MSNEEIALLKQKFVPVVFNTYNKRLPEDGKVWTDAFRSWVCVPRAALPIESRLPGKSTMCFFAASGRPIKINAALRTQPLNRRLQEVLDVFTKLPEADRSPAAAKTKPDLSRLKYHRGEEPPQGRLVLRAYNRILTRDEDKGYRAARVNWTQFMTEDTSFFEGAPKFKAEGSMIRAPMKDMFWLMEAEWKALVPARPKEGDKLAVPQSASRRLFLYGCHNWWAVETLERLWGPESIQQGDLTVTIAGVSATEVTMHLDGAFQMANSKDKPCKAAYKGQVSGVLCYDLGKKAFTRFDMVVLGDYQGLFYCRSKPMGPMLIAF